MEDKRASLCRPNRQCVDRQRFTQHYVLKMIDGAGIRLLLVVASSIVLLVKGITVKTASESIATPGIETWTSKAWKGVLSDLPFETKAPRSLRVTGAVPSDLVGILYKAGPAKFQRNGQSYAHWLEGDGAVIRVEFDQNQQVTYTSRFVQTESFQKDEVAGYTTVRGTFGTPKAKEPNAFDICLKNPANTNAVRINDRVLALSEVGMPYQLDATTLKTLGMETFNGLYSERNSAATVGTSILDKMLGFGDAMVAHVRHVPLEENTKPNLVMAAIKQHALTDDTILDLWELDAQTGHVLGLQKEISLKDTGFPPHDFVSTTRHAIWLTCPAGGNLVPFILGEKGPAECLSFRKGATTTLHLVQRGGLNDADIPPTVQRYNLPRVIHPVHFGCAWETPADDGVIIYLSGWDTPSMNQMIDRQESLLGSWSCVQEGDFSNIQPQPLLKVTLRKGENLVTVERIAQNVIDHIDFLKCHPDWEGRQCRFLYGSVATPPTPETPSGISPPQTICIVDLVEEKVVDTWFAGFDNILDDFIIVPKKTKSDDGERNAWVIAPVYHEATKSTSFVVLDASNLSNGPVCEAHLDDHHVPWALHGTWWSN